MKKNLFYVALIIIFSAVLGGCNIKVPEPLSPEGFQQVFTTIEGETMELSTDLFTDQAARLLLGRMHDVNIVYYQMETEEDAGELFNTIREELIQKDDATTKAESSTVYRTRGSGGSYFLKHDRNVVLLGTGFEDDDEELRYLFYKLGYYKYDTTYFKNQVEVYEQTFGY